MNPFDLALLDELRREFRRTRPPAYMLIAGFEACICQIQEGPKVGFRVIWKRQNDALPLNSPIVLHGRTVTILELL